MAIFSSLVSTWNAYSKKWKHDDKEEEKRDEENEEEEKKDEESLKLFSDHTNKGKEVERTKKPPSKGRKAKESDFNVSQTGQAKKKCCKSVNLSAGATALEKWKKWLTDKKFEEGKMSKDSRIY